MRAEHDLKQWGEKQGYRVADDGVLEGNGKPNTAKTVVFSKDGDQ